LTSAVLRFFAVVMRDYSSRAESRSRSLASFAPIIRGETRFLRMIIGDYRHGKIAAPRLPIFEELDRSAPEPRQQRFAVEVLRFRGGARTIFESTGFEAAAGHHHPVRAADPLDLRDH